MYKEKTDDNNDATQKTTCKRIGDFTMDRPQQESSGVSESSQRPVEHQAGRYSMLLRSTCNFERLRMQSIVSRERESARREAEECSRDD